MSKTYYSSAKGIRISRKRAAKEILNHGINPQEFFDECGFRDFYNAQSVLAWLGY